MDCINKNKWNFIDSYVDEGRSGTSSKKRDEYNRLFEDISKDKWDIIVIKSQDRLMRNAKDWYIFINELVTNNKKLFMFMENSFYKSDNSLFTGIKAILAEEYSRDLSKKLNNAHKRRSAEGSSVMSNNRIWGYTKCKGELVIDENEAIIVKRIFEMYVEEKKGTREIINELNKEGITAKNGKKFASTTINRILKNEKYMGTMICNKQHKDFETKKTIKNPKNEWIIHENRIPAIVSKETFEKAQNIRHKRYQIQNPSGNKTGKRETKHALGGKIFCGYCGKIMWYNAVKKTYKKDDRVEYRYPWMCSTYCQLGRIGLGKYPEEGCNKKNINDNYLTEELIKLAEKLNNDKFKNNVIRNCIKLAEDKLQKTNNKFNMETLQNRIKELENKQNLLVDKYLDNVIPEQVYRRKNKEIENELLTHNNNLDKMIQILKNEKEKDEQILELKKICETQLNGNLTYDDICQLISKIIAYDDRIEIYLNIMEDMCFTINKSLEFITNTFKATHYDDNRK
jgi:DNA invertase Pin-like site-specific DNA recombinase